MRGLEPARGPRLGEPTARRVASPVFIVLQNGMVRREEPRGGRRDTPSRKTGNVVFHEVDPDNPPRLTPEQEARLRRLEAMPDSEIDFSDIPEVTEETWDKTTLECVRVDAEVMEWILRQSGPDRWEEKLNAMLRRAMAEEREALRERA